MLAAKLGLNAVQQARLRGAVTAWQRLVWAAECLQHGGVYFGGRPEQLPRDGGEAAMLLVALADLLEPLLHSPELLRVLPKRADAYLYRRHATKALLDSIAIRRERELAEIFATDIRERRHYTLDHIARVELGGRYGVERVTLAPEQRGDGDAFFTGFIVEHMRHAERRAQARHAPRQAPQQEGLARPADARAPASSFEAWSHLPLKARRTAHSSSKSGEKK